MDSTKNGSQTQSVQPADEKGYNGWTNFETWTVHHWISNEEVDFSHFKEVVNKHDSVTDAAKAIEQEFWDNHPLEDSDTVFFDLLDNALSEVSWHEIAKALMEE